jgi:hypothetical protein
MTTPKKNKNPDKNQHKKQPKKEKTRKKPKTRAKTPYLFSPARTSGTYAQPVSSVFMRTSCANSGFSGFREPSGNLPGYPENS